jgi:FkbM family methyltransferase
MSKVYANVNHAFERYFFDRGVYPYDIQVSTSAGKLQVQLYIYHDILTVDEIFCRNDCPFDFDLRVVVDLGSNIGTSALYFMSHNSKSRCYLFEPDPKNIKKLHQQLASFKGRYDLGECAVSNSYGVVPFGVEDTGRYGGMGFDTGKSITVACRDINCVLEDAIEKEGFINILKIDTEGVEIATVKAINHQYLSHISHIYIEACPDDDLLPGMFSQKQYGSVCQLSNIHLDNT